MCRIQRCHRQLTARDAPGHVHSGYRTWHNSQFLVRYLHHQSSSGSLIHNTSSYTPYTPPAISKPQSYDDTESVHPGPIIAGVLGGLAVVAVVGATIFFIRRRRQERQEKAVDAEIATRRQSQAEGLDMKQAYAAIDWSPPSLAHTRPSRAPSMGSVKEEPEQQR